MAKYILVYKTDQAADLSLVPKEEIAKIMEAWGEWLGSMGSAVVDSGDAFNNNGKVLSSTGVKDADNLTTGYTIIEADNFDQALEMAQGNPSLKDGDKIEIYEAFGLEG